MATVGEGHAPANGVDYSTYKSGQRRSVRWRLLVLDGVRRVVVRASGGSDSDAVKRTGRSFGDRRPRETRQTD
jgi:hypothetical protein